MSTHNDQRSPGWLNSVIAWLLRWRIWILSSITLVIFGAQLVEHYNYHPRFSLIFWGESFLFIVFVVIIMVLLETLIRAQERITRAYKILDVKHLLTEQLSGALGWRELSERLFEYIGSLAPIISVDLLIPNQDALDMEIFTSRESGEGLNRKAESSVAATYYQNCCSQEKNILHSMQSCNVISAFQSEELSNGYCLPIGFGNSQTALLLIYSAPTSSLSTEQVEILNNIGPDIAVALKIVQQQMALSETLVFHTADSTRREISRDLHDTLGQNLSYLRFKLDQFTRNGAQVDMTEIRPDLLSMYATASESLDLLRDTLVGLQPGNQSRLADYLHEHGKLISERANFDLQFNSRGTPFPLTTSTLRQILYVYREALNNIERHASANQVEVNLDWGRNELTILIEDNGKGFNPERVQTDQHYGIKIMQERMAALSGSIHLDTSEGAGTRLTIYLPLVA